MKCAQLRAALETFFSVLFGTHSTEIMLAFYIREPPPPGPAAKSRTASGGRSGRGGGDDGDDDSAAAALHPSTPYTLK